MRSRQWLCALFVASIIDAATSETTPGANATLAEPIVLTNTPRLTRLGNSSQAPHPNGHRLRDAVEWLGRHQHARTRKQIVQGRTPVSIVVQFDVSNLPSESQRAAFEDAAVSAPLCCCLQIIQVLTCSRALVLRHQPSAPRDSETGMHGCGCAHVCARALGCAKPNRATSSRYDFALQSQQLMRLARLARVAGCLAVVYPADETSHVHQLADKHHPHRSVRRVYRRRWGHTRTGWSNRGIHRCRFH
jgi:hypothetical protein